MRVLDPAYIWLLVKENRGKRRNKITRMSNTAQNENKEKRGSKYQELKDRGEDYRPSVTASLKERQ